MYQQIQNLVNEIRRMAKNTGIDPDPGLYRIEGNVLSRMSQRLEYVTAFLAQVNKQLEHNTKPKKKTSKTTKKLTSI